MATNRESDILRKLARLNPRHKNVGRLEGALLDEVVLNSAQTRNLRRLFKTITSMALNAKSGSEESAEQFQNMTQALKDASSQVEQIYGRVVDEVINSAKQLAESDIIKSLTPDMRRKVFGIPFDQYGMPKPRPGQPGIVTPSMSTQDIIRTISPLISISGDTTLYQREGLILHGEDTAIPEARRGIEDPWQRRVRGLNLDIQRQAALFVQFNAQMLRQHIDSPSTTSWRTRAFKELSHDARRTFAIHKDHILVNLPDDIFVGFILYSIKQPSSDPEHVNRDGWRFYRDNRKGSRLPWSQRLVPPYRKFCLCFTQELYENPEGDEYLASWDAWPRLSGARVIRREDIGIDIYDTVADQFVTVQPSDVGTTIGRHDAVAIEPRDVWDYRDWFNSQNPEVRQVLMGDRRYLAVQSVRDGVPSYEDFFSSQGKVLSVNKILDETKAQRNKRLDLVKTAMRLQHVNHVRQWEKTGNKWSLTPEEENQYQRRLDVFLSRILRAA